MTAASPRTLEPSERVIVDFAVETGERERLVEPEAEHDPLAPTGLRVELLELARRRLTGFERGHVARERW